MHPSVLIEKEVFCANIDANRWLGIGCLNKGKKIVRAAGFLDVAKVKDLLAQKAIVVRAVACPCSGVVVPNHQRP